MLTVISPNDTMRYECYLHADGDFAESAVGLGLLVGQQLALLGSLALQLVHQLLGVVQL